MKKICLILILVIIFSGVFICANTSFARSGCCSWHQGVCGCSCCDGTPLSSTCAPYYPNCSSGYNFNTPSYTATPSCPLFSSYDSISKQCKCNSGYIVDTDFLGNQTCISVSIYCHNKYGYGSSYDTIGKQCKCDSGYLFVNNKCEDSDTYCQNLLGYGAEYSLIYNKCDCRFGYEFNGSKCVVKSLSSSTSFYNYLQTNQSSCPLNASLKTDGYCYCNTGYQTNTEKNACVEIICPLNSNKIGSSCICNDGYIYKNNSCITYSQDCMNSFGSNVYGVKGDNDSSCYCNPGYIWNTDKTACIIQTLNINNTVTTSLYQRPSMTVVIPSVINSYTGMYGRKVFTDRPDPLTIIGAMVKGETDPATYIVDTDGKLKWIKTEDVAKRLFGTAWDGYITWFSDSIIYTYKFGDTIEQ